MVAGEVSHICAEERLGLFLTDHFRGLQSGQTCLHLASREGRAAAVMQLLAAGAAVDTKDGVSGGVLARVGK